MPKKKQITDGDPQAQEVLSDCVEISRQFLRSVRVDTDYGREDALHGYVCQGTARSLLENMAKQITDTKQRAFTWTGPYGGGKSSLALVLCSLVSPNRNLQEKAREVLGLPVDSEVLKAFHPGHEGWLVLPVVGRRENVVTAIDDILNQTEGGEEARARKPGRPRTVKGAEVIARLVAAAKNRKSGGVLLVIDELGKFLESAAQTGEDVYFYQELAEAASRCGGMLVVVGVLHQAFEQYAARLGREARDEWAKVQGRYVDISLVAGTDEVVELVSRAIAFKKPVVHDDTRVIVDAIVASIRSRRPGAPKNLEDGLFRCWPLHPITAALLGPISKRRFGQNERSTFGFLASHEPFGFTEFLASRVAAPLALYGPARYWEYLRANLEQAILASPDGHRWSVGVEALERAESRGRAVHVDLVKTIALIELFKNGSGLAADNDVLAHALEHSSEEIAHALEDLRSWSVIIFRKHLNAWGIYSGSDFDIDAAVVAARAEIGAAGLKRVSELSDLYPVIAKRVYQETGTMRWFSRSILLSGDVEDYVAGYRPAAGSCGEFILVLPNRDDGRRVAENRLIELTTNRADVDFALIVGLPVNAGRIVELGMELTALEHVRSNRPELEGDNVARREIDARISVTRSELEEQLRDAFTLATWHYDSKALNIDSRKGLSTIASQVAKELYRSTPHVASELVNRDHISSNAKSALRELLHRMLHHGDRENLGYDGYPADAGLYYTVIQSAGLHREVDGQWRFIGPDNENRGATFQKIWEDTTALLAVPDKTTCLDELYALWAARPFGVRAGVMPILALTYFLANRQHLAMYVEGVFSPELTDATVDEWLQDEKRISFRYVQIEGQRKELLEGLAASLTERLGRSVAVDPLDSARGLVALAYGLPAWTRRTEKLSPIAKEVRQLLLRASDPHKVLFTDLPVLFADHAGGLVDGIVSVIEELSEAYPRMLASVEARLLKALDHEGSWPDLQRRGSAVKGIAGEFLLDAFVTRLCAYDGSTAAREGMISLAVSKPTKDSNDRDIDAAILKLGEWALEFRKTETLASLQGRPSHRRAIAVVFGASKGHSVSDTFDVAESDAPAIDRLAKQFLATLTGQGVKREVFLAALAEAGASVVEQSRKEE